MFDNPIFYGSNGEHINIIQKVFEGSEPHDYQFPFSVSSKYKDDLKFVKFKIKGDYQQLLKFQTLKGGNFLLIKRDITECNIPKDKILLNEDMRDAINNSVRENYVTKLLSSHSCGITPLDFQITKLESHNFLITELLLEEAGDFPLPMVVQRGELNDKLKLKYLLQSSSVLCYSQKMKIPNIDIKASNFLIDDNKDLRIISYDILQYGTKLYKIMFKGSEVNYYLTEGYCSPEAYLYFQNYKDFLNTSNEIFDLSKSSSYSWGILALFILGGINSIQISKLDVFKKSLKDHENVLKFIENIKIIDPELKAKMKYLLFGCLNYLPEKRIRLHDINKILLDFEKGKADYIKKKIDEILCKERNTKDEISKKIELLKESKSKEGFDELKQQIFSLLDKKDKDYNLIEGSILESKAKNTELLQENSIVWGIINEQRSEISSLKNQIISLKSGNANSDSKEVSIINEIGSVNRPKITKATPENDNNFNSQILNNINIILKGKNILKNLPNLNDLPNLLKELIPFNTSPFQVNCQFCKKVEEFFEAKKCIYQNLVDETRFFTWGILCLNGKHWNLCEVGLTKNEISALTLIASMSPILEFIDFGFNPDFDESSSEELVKCLNINNSLKGICLFKNNIAVKYIKAIVNLFKTKKNLICFYVDIESLSPEDAKTLAIENNLELNKWNTKNDYWKKSYYQNYQFASDDSRQTTSWFFGR